MTAPASPGSSAMVPPGAIDQVAERTRPMLHGAAYALCRDPDYRGIFQLAVRSQDGSIGAGRLDRDQLRTLVSDGVSELQEPPLAVARSGAAASLAALIRRDLELLRDLWLKGDPAAEILLKTLFDHLKSWQPSLTSGTLAP